MEEAVRGAATGGEATVAEVKVDEKVILLTCDLALDLPPTCDEMNQTFS